jgi:hypothetical protein
MPTIALPVSLKYKFALNEVDALGETVSYVQVTMFNTTILFNLDPEDHAALITDFQTTSKLERFVSLLASDPFTAHDLYTQGS